MPSSPTAARSDASGFRSLYVHSPFCARRCPYCDFSVVARPDAAAVTSYAEALGRELRLRASGLRPRTVFVGGGTPSFLPPLQLERFLSLLSDRVDLSRCVEFSVEANPEDLDATRARLLVAGGVTRLSLGAQSFDAPTLRRLGRRHRARDVLRAVENARAAGLRSINVDLIVAVPGEPVERLDADLDTLLSLSVEHVSVYALTFESGTAYDRARRLGRLRPPSEDEQLRSLRRACDRLEEAGLARYEVSNFARPGHRCLHNLECWRRRPYLGVGPSACSLLGRDRRTTNPRRFGDWLRAALEGPWRFDVDERLTPRQALREALLLGLRRVEGIRERELAPWGGFAALDAATLERGRGLGVLSLEGDRLRATRRGLEVLDALLVDLV